MNTIAQIKGVHHVSINVADVHAAKRFYVELLGLEDLPRPDLGFPGAWLRAGTQEIHLLGINAGVPLKGQHFAFEVDDLHSLINSLVQQGNTVSEPNEIPGVCVQAFTHDPSGNMVEFNQRL